MRAALLGPLALLVCSLVACDVGWLHCDSDSDCDDDEWCFDGVCVVECAVDADCGDGLVCAADGRGCVAAVDDGGPPADGGGGGGGLSVTLTADAPLVDAGAPVTLSWTSAPSADSCELMSRTSFEASFSTVSGAPVTGSGFHGVAPEQDTEYRIACEKGSESGEASVSVDVNASGTLAASPSEVNAGESATLSWTAFGVSACILEGPGSLAYSVPSAEVAAGSYLVEAAAAGPYSLVCDGVSVAEASIAVASLSIIDVSPSALGPSAEEVTIAWAYVGPSPASCAVSLDGAVAADASLAMGHQVSLSETTVLSVSCDGYGGPVSASVEVPRLITSASVNEAVISYGASTEVSFTASSGASCSIDGVAATSPSSLGPLTSSGIHVLSCTEGGKTATYEVAVSVRAGFVEDEVTGSLWKTAPTTPEADVVVTAWTTPNATACVVAGHFAAPEAMVLADSQADRLVWELLVSREGTASSATGPAGDGAFVYSVTCESDPGLGTTSDVDVSAWWGDVTTAVLASFGRSGSTMVTGDVTITGAAASLTSLGALKLIGDDLLVDGTSGLERLTGLESLVGVLGGMVIRSNDNLEETSNALGGRGLLALSRVDGDVIIGGVGQGNGALTSVTLPGLSAIGGLSTISSNGALQSITMSALSTIDGGLMVSSNGALQSVTMSALSSVGGSFVLEQSESLADVPGGNDGFGSLVTIGGAFTITNTGLASLASYFPELDVVEGSVFSITSNAYLPCADAEALYCGLTEAPSGANIALNNGSSGSTCSVSSPACS